MAINWFDIVPVWGTKNKTRSMSGFYFFMYFKVFHSTAAISISPPPAAKGFVNVYMGIKQFFAGVYQFQLCS